LVESEQALQTHSLYIRRKLGLVILVPSQHLLKALFVDFGRFMLQYRRHAARQEDFFQAFGVEREVGESAKSPKRLA
jgi:hypothetical protein